MAKCHNAIFNEMPHTASQPAGQSVSWSTAAKKKQKNSMIDASYMYAYFILWYQFALGTCTCTCCIHHVMYMHTMRN